METTRDFIESRSKSDIFKLSFIHYEHFSLEQCFGRVTKATFLFRRIGYKQDWLEDFLFYGRGRLPKGHRWVDHCSVEVVYLTSPTLFHIECETHPYIDEVSVKSKYIATSRFWYTAEFKSEVPSRLDRDKKCAKSCEHCWSDNKKKATLPNYMTKTTYSDKGESHLEKHYKLPKSTFTARPPKRGLGGIPFHKVEGLKPDNASVSDSSDKVRLKRKAQPPEFCPPHPNKVPKFIYEES